MVGLRSKLYNIRNEISVILFFSYIYDAVRDAFIDGGRRRFRNYLTESYHTFEDFDAKSDHEANSVGSGDSSNRRAILFEGSNDFKFRFNRIYIEFMAQFQQKKPERSKRKAFCELGPMPKYARIYQIISASYMASAFVKYVLISLILYTKLFKNKIHACYLPGRLYFINDYDYELPAFTLVMVSYHVIYRTMWYITTPRLDLDCFIFALLPESLLQEKIDNLSLINNESEKSYLAYLKNLLFYQRIDLGNGEYEYVIRESRSLDHLRKLKAYIRFITMFWMSCFFILGIPVIILLCYSWLSNTIFDRMYFNCRSFSGRDPADPNFNWRYTDRFRLVCLVFDGADCIMMGVDTLNAMIWPFSSSVICTRDLCFRLEVLKDRLDQFKRRLIRVNENSRIFKNMSRKDQEKWNERRVKDEILIDYELRRIQTEIMETFEQVNKVDLFARQFSAFCIYVWVSMNGVFQIFSMLHKRLLIINSVVQFFQLIGITLLTFTFFQLSRVHTLGLAIHKHLCTIIAVDRNPLTKFYWIWYMGYYDQLTTRFTLHVGHDAYTLSMGVYLRSMVWFFSLSLLTVNVLRLELKNLVA